MAADNQRTSTLAYFEDLSAYTYQSGPDVVSRVGRSDATSPPFLAVESTRPRVNVGWLGGRGRFGRRNRFPTGRVSNDVIDALVDVIEAQAVNITRGFHSCQYCPGNGAAGQLRFLHHERSVPMGNGEIRIPAADETVFAAPTLIGHYVRDHHYCPPAAFTDGLLAFRHATADLAQGWFSNPSER